MIKHGVSKAAIANATGKTVQTVDNWMANKTQPNAIEMEPIFQIFRIKLLTDFVGV